MRLLFLARGPPQRSNPRLRIFFFFSTDNDLLAAKCRPAESSDNLVGQVFRYFDQGKAVGNFDCAERAGFDTRLSGDGSHQVARANACLPARADINTSGVIVTCSPGVFAPLRLFCARFELIA